MRKYREEHMNLSFLKYDFISEMKRNNYNWHDILFALENQIIKTEDVIDYSVCILNEGILGFEIVLEISCLDSNEDVYPYLYDLIELEKGKYLSDVKDKWLYLILKWLYENKHLIQNIMDIVEEVYEIFDYPDSIISFVRYMPSEEGDLGSPELNKEKLFKNWKKYLELYKEEYQNNSNEK